MSVSFAIHFAISMLSTTTSPESSAEAILTLDFSVMCGANTTRFVWKLETFASPIFSHSLPTGFAYTSSTFVGTTDLMPYPQRYVSAEPYSLLLEFIAVIRPIGNDQR